MTAAHVGVAFAIRRRVAEVAPTLDHLLGRAAAYTELQPTAPDQVGRARVFGHVKGVLIAHVDHAGADLNAASPCADGRQQREGRGELLGEVMDAEVGAIGAELLGRDRKVDGLQEHVARRTHRRLRRGRPMAERQETDLLHGTTCG